MAAVISVALSEWSIPGQLTTIHLISHAGGVVTWAIAGYGRHGVLREQSFLELAGEMTVLVEFIVDEDAAAKLIDIVHEDGAPLFWAKISAEFGVVGQR